MSKLFSKEKNKHIDLINNKNEAILFIQDDTSFPSKIVSIKLSEIEINKLINKLKESIIEINKK